MIAPGFIDGTEGVERLTPRDKKGGKVSYSRYPAGRMGHVKDIGNAAVFLFSDVASYISGQIIAVDGGSHHLQGSFVPYPESVLVPMVKRAKL